MCCAGGVVAVPVLMGGGGGGGGSVCVGVLVLDVFALGADLGPWVG